MPEDSFKRVTRRGYIGTAGLLFGGVSGAWAVRRVAADRDLPEGIDVDGPNLPEAPTDIRDDDPKDDTPDNDEPDNDTPDNDDDMEDVLEGTGFDDIEAYADAVQDTLEVRQNQYTLFRETVIKEADVLSSIQKRAPHVEPEDTYFDSKYVVFEHEESVDEPEWFRELNSDYASIADEGHPVLDLEDWEERHLSLGIREDTYYREWELNALSRVFKHLSKIAGTAREQEIEQIPIEDRSEDYEPVQAVREQSLDTLYKRTVATQNQVDDDTDEYELLSGLADSIDAAIGVYEGEERHYRDAADMVYFAQKRSFFEDGECVEQ